MDYVGRLSNLLSSVSKVYNELNPATLSGAIDIVVVEQPNGDLACSPFHVRFGKLSLLMPQEKKVSFHFYTTELSMEESATGWIYHVFGDKRQL